MINLLGVVVGVDEADVIQSNLGLQLLDEGEALLCVCNALVLYNNHPVTHESWQKKLRVKRRLHLWQRAVI